VSVSHLLRSLVDIYLPDACIFSSFSFRHFALVRSASAQDEGAFLSEIISVFVPLPHVYIAVKTAGCDDIKLFDIGHLVDEIVMGLPSPFADNIVVIKFNLLSLLIGSQEGALLANFNVIRILRS